MCLQKLPLFENEQPGYQQEYHIPTCPMSDKTVRMKQELLRNYLIWVKAGLIKCYINRSIDAESHLHIQ